MVLIQNAAMIILIPAVIECKRHVKLKFLSIFDQKHLCTTFLLSFWNDLTFFLKIVWLHLRMTPSIVLENKDGIGLILKSVNPTFATEQKKVLIHP